MSPEIQATSLCGDRFRPALEILARGVESRAFPGASLVVVHQEKVALAASLGRFTYEASSPPITRFTVFDLASVTKVLATTAAAMVLFERGRLALEMPVAELLPEFVAGTDDSRRKQVTVRMLLAHSSGLPGYVRLFERARGRREIIKAACEVPLSADPMSRAEYSDIGFIVLGAALERAAGEELDGFCRREIFEALDMDSTWFCPPPDEKTKIPPTDGGNDFRGRLIQGEVHDENAAAMGGVAGHAGVFSSATDVSKFAQCMLRGGSPILRSETVQIFTRKEELPPGTDRALGWDTPSQPSQSGRLFSLGSYGHLGFTGTSLWCDPKKQAAVILLTNRVWPDRKSEEIKQIRPAVHDAVMSALEER
jgi:CubicO group peptidase (beta-lactamase class C family)